MNEERGSTVAGLRGGITDEDDCPYLDGRRWRNLIIEAAGGFSPSQHEFFLDQGFRRMGTYLYRPVCEGCSECRPLRVIVDEYRPSKSQRRAWNRNRDVTVEIMRPKYDEEKRALLERYLAVRHSGPMTADEKSMKEFMYRTDGESYIVDLRVEGSLVGSGIVDLLPDVVSSVYFFFDPDEASRSLGVFSTMVEIAFAKERKRRYYHPGFFVADCSAMNYKARFHPCELLKPDGEWRPLSPPSATPSPQDQATPEGA